MTPLNVLGAAIIILCVAPVAGFCVGKYLGKKGMLELFPYIAIPPVFVYLSCAFLGLLRFGWALLTGEIK